MFMNVEREPVLEIPFTYLLPMREDNPAFADFDRLYCDVREVMGEDYPSALITRINTMLAGNGLSERSTGVDIHYAQQESGEPGSVKAVTFNAPLTIEQVSHTGRYIGPVAARALVQFAVPLRIKGSATT